MTVLRHVALISALALLWPAAAGAVSPIEFQVLHDGEDIGRHKVTIVQDGNTMRVSVDVRLRVLLAGFVPVYHYDQAVREVWRDGRLISFDSKTDNNGREKFARGTPNDVGLAVTSKAGTVAMPVNIMPTGNWAHHLMNQSELLDSEDGKLLKVSTRLVGSEPVEAHGQVIQARHYIVDGDVKVELWYDESGDWVKCRFNAYGAMIEYRLL